MHATEYTILFIAVVVASIGIACFSESMTIGLTAFGVLCIFLGIWVYVRESCI